LKVAAELNKNVTESNNFLFASCSYVGYRLVSRGEMRIRLNCMYNFVTSMSYWDGNPNDLDTCEGNVC